jgi:hypothetical protein
MNSISPTIHPAVIRYAHGEISSSRAISLLGDDATMHDLVFQLRAAGLEPPRQPREVELAQLAKARKLFGMAS